jgi:multidrug efflux pump subunit AcrA (membrane-fusion protein)
MSFFSSISLPSFLSSKPADPVAAAQAKVDSAQAALTKAKEEVTRLETELSAANTELSQAKSTPPANTVDGVQGGRRKRTYRNKEKRPAKRRRNGRKSIRS